MNSMHKIKISLLMVHISFVNISHLNSLKFKYLTGNQFYLSLMDWVCQCTVYPMCKKVTWSLTSLTFGINQGYKIKCSSNIFTRCLIINLLLMGFKIFI